MADTEKLEKIIMGLQKTIDTIHLFVPNQYWYDTENSCNDALTLLKAQEPRILALDEIHRGMVVWLEDSDKPDTIIAIGGASAGKAKCFITVDDVSVRAWDDEYNVRWRAWTLEPTDEQRQAVKWG